MPTRDQVPERKQGRKEGGARSRRNQTAEMNKIGSPPQTELTT